jgi:hypothetical protein
MIYKIGHILIELEINFIENSFKNTFKFRKI